MRWLSPPKKSISGWSDSDRLRPQSANRPEPHTLLKHASASSQEPFSMELRTSSTLLKQPEAKICVTCDQLVRPCRGRGDVCEEQTHTCSLRPSSCCSRCAMPSTVACQSLPAVWWLQLRPRPRKIHAHCSRSCRYSGQMPLNTKHLHTDGWSNWIWFIEILLFLCGLVISVNRSHSCLSSSRPTC